MKLADVSKAIRNRLISDSTLTNTLVGASSRILMGQVPKSADFGGNAIVYNISGVGTADTATGDIRQLSIEFLIRVLRDGDEGPDAALLIIDRLRGDWNLQPTKVPSYGLHRYQPALTGGVAETHALTHFTEDEFGPVDVEDPDLYVAYSVLYTGHVQTLP